MAGGHLEENAQLLHCFELGFESPVPDHIQIPLIRTSSRIFWRVIAFRGSLPQTYPLYVPRLPHDCHTHSSFEKFYFKNGAPSRFDPSAASVHTQ